MCQDRKRGLQHPLPAERGRLTAPAAIAPQRRDATLHGQPPRVFDWPTHAAIATAAAGDDAAPRLTLPSPHALGCQTSLPPPRPRPLPCPPRGVRGAGGGMAGRWRTEGAAVAGRGGGGPGRFGGDRDGRDYRSREAVRGGNA